MIFEIILTISIMIFIPVVIFLITVAAAIYKEWTK